MFYRHKWLCKQGKLFEPWVAASYNGNFLSPYTKLLGLVDIHSVCCNLEEVILSNSHNINHRISLKLSIKLIHGTCLLFQKQLQELYDNCCEIYLQSSTKRPFEDFLNMTSSDTTSSVSIGRIEVSNENNSHDERAFCNPDERAAGIASQPGYSGDFTATNPKLIPPFTEDFIGIRSLRQDIRRSSSNGTPSAPIKTVPIRRKRRKRQYRQAIPTLRGKIEQTRKTNINEDHEENNQRALSPEVVRGHSENEDSPMSFNFQWQENLPDDILHSTAAMKSSDARISHRLSQHKKFGIQQPEERNRSSSSDFPLMDISSDGDIHLENLFVEKNIQSQNVNNNKCFHLLYPKGMDVRKLKIFTGPITSYDQLGQSNVEYSSTEGSPRISLSSSRNNRSRDDFDENGVLCKLFKLWSRNSVVSIMNILNMGNCISHTKMAAGKIFASLMNLKKHCYVDIIKSDDGKIKNIVRGKVLRSKLFQYHPYSM